MGIFSIVMSIVFYCRFPDLPHHGLFMGNARIVDVFEAGTAIIIGAERRYNLDEYMADKRALAEEIPDMPQAPFLGHLWKPLLSKTSYFSEIEESQTFHLHSLPEYYFRVACRGYSRPSVWMEIWPSRSEVGVWNYHIQHQNSELWLGEYDGDTLNQDLSSYEDAKVFAQAKLAAQNPRCLRLKYPHLRRKVTVIWSFDTPEPFGLSDNLP